MSRDKEIIIDINENGDCSIEGVGFVGAECETLISQIQNSLGVRQTFTQKPEYNQRVSSPNRLRNRT